MKINLVMIVKNEQRCLRRCLESVKGLVDDIIIADTGSQDATKEIAKCFGASVYDFVWRDDFAAARNFALQQSDADWNLVLDADEYLRIADRTDLERQIKYFEQRLHGAFIGAIVRYDCYIEPDKVTQGSSVSNIPRLLPRGVYYTGKIHEQPDTSLPCYQLSLEAEHDGYLGEDKAQRNLPYLYKAVEEYPDDGYYRYQLAVTLRNMGRLEEALEQFRIFYKLTKTETGYRSEGVLLYVYTLSDLAGEIFLQEAFEVLQQEERKLGHRADYHFACGIFYMKFVLANVEKNISYLPRIEQSYLTCLRIGENPKWGGVVGTGSFRAWYNLGTWYEVSGQTEKAGYCYEQSAELGYEPAKQRLKIFSEKSVG